MLTLPCLDYASTLIASGVVAESFRDQTSAALEPGEFRNRIGEAVGFPYRHTSKSSLKRLRGVIAEIDDFGGSERLLVRFVDNERKKFTRAVDRRWLSLIRPLAEMPDLHNAAGGSLLAKNIAGLEAVVGQGGAIRLLEESHQGCCILDTKKRVRAEAKQSVIAERLGVNAGGEEVVLRDVVRLASEGPEAMAATHCCQVFGEPPPGWPATVIAGSMKFLRGWDDCDSAVRVALVSPVENAYRDALAEANQLFLQRDGPELELPGEILAIKPEGIDFQLFYSD